MPGAITYLRFVFLVLICFEAMVLSYVFPVLSRFDNTVKNTIKNSILMAIRHLPWTIMILLVNLCPLLIYVFSTTKIVSYLILLMFLLGFSTVALGCSWFFVNKIFPFYMPEEEKEVLTPEEESLRALEAMDRPSPLTDRSRSRTHYIPAVSDQGNTKVLSASDSFYGAAFAFIPHYILTAIVQKYNS